MCVFAAGATGLFGLGASASNAFLANLGLQGFTTRQQNRRAKKAADYQYEAAARSAESAERAFAQQQEGLAANLKETRAAKAQERLEATLQGQQARGSIAATEGLSGRTAQLLSRDAIRQAANLRNSINQTMQGATRQYRRNALGLLAQRDSRRNSAIDIQNQAYNTARQNSSGIFDLLGAGVKSYTGLLGRA
jgi:hypothetical protein